MPKITKKQKIVLIIMIIAISLILYNIFFRKSEHATSIAIDEKLELVKNTNSINTHLKNLV